MAADTEALKAKDPALYSEVKHLKAMHNKHPLTKKGAHSDPQTGTKSIVSQ